MKNKKILRLYAARSKELDLQFEKTLALFHALRDFPRSTRGEKLQGRVRNILWCRFGILRPETIRPACGRYRRYCRIIIRRFPEFVAG